MPDGWDGEAVTIRWTSSTPLLTKMLMASCLPTRRGPTASQKNSLAQSRQGDVRLDGARNRRIVHGASSCVEPTIYRRREDGQARPGSPVIAFCNAGACRTPATTCSRATNVPSAVAGGLALNYWFDSGKYR
jgi:hypothetical protein